MKLSARLLIVFFLIPAILSAQGNADHYHLLKIPGHTEIRAIINLPDTVDSTKITRLILYPLPNGNTIEQTVGKLISADDDWHFDIQHIAAQTRFVRQTDPGSNYIVVYLENNLLSWPSWKAANPDHKKSIPAIVEFIKSKFSKLNTEIILSGHSGGGSLVNGFIEESAKIPAGIKRITFLDSNYGYNDEIGKKLVDWLQTEDRNRLCVLAYNDSIALYKGKPFVSATGGTWYRSKMMARFFSEFFEMNKFVQNDLIYFESAGGQIQIILKTNPNREIFHTKQVEQNGFIHSLFYGTEFENRNYRYFGERAYQQFIDDGSLFRQLKN